MTGTQVQDESRRALFGWSPPDLLADTALKRRTDRLLPRTGWAAALYCAAVIVLLNLAPHLPERGNLAFDGLAALAAAAWCGLNFWRCRHAHCLVTSTGWAALSLLAFTGAVLGRSLIDGYEQPVFLVVLAAAVVFEVAWRLSHGSNAIGCGAELASRPAALSHPWPPRCQGGDTRRGNVRNADSDPTAAANDRQ
jgi:hypothetical protein